MSDHDAAAAQGNPAETLLRVAVLHEDQIRHGGLELLHQWDEHGQDSVWIDISRPTQHDIEPLLEEWFRFHELAAEDALSENTLPKYDRFGKYDFFVFRSIVLELENRHIDAIKLSCFLGRNFVVTIHGVDLPAIDSVWNRLPQDSRILARGTDFLLYLVLDHLVDQHFPLLDQVEDRLEDIQTVIFSEPSPELLDELLDLKRQLNLMRRHSLPQRELFNQISRGDAQFIRAEHLIYFRDLYDHMYRISESIDIERDMAAGTTEAYLSVVANRTNDIMKVLTIFSAIMLPLNLIAAIYGMNFTFMPELGWRLGYPFALLLMLAIGVVMLGYFWRRGWIRDLRSFQSRRMMLRSRRYRSRRRTLRAG